MTTMLDKVARALFDAEWGDIRAESEWEGLGKKDYWRASARAALQAIRVPDEAMLHAGQQNPSIAARPLWKCTSDVQCGVRFTAMIDAILEEKPE